MASGYYIEKNIDWGHFLTILEPLALVSKCSSKCQRKARVVPVVMSKVYKQEIACYQQWSQAKGEGKNTVSRNTCDTWLKVFEIRAVRCANKSCISKCQLHLCYSFSNFFLHFSFDFEYNYIFLKHMLSGRYFVISKKVISSQNVYIRESICVC